MKDQVKEFEDLNNRIEKLFEGLGWINPSNWFQDKPKLGATKEYVSNNPSLNKYLSDIDAKKSNLGAFNNRFTSEPGSTEATFYNQKGAISGHVRNIQPFLQNAGISKEILRTYDLKKDKLGIKWLFDNPFDAEFLDWDKKNRKVIFKGVWKGGHHSFNGIEYKELGAKSTIKRSSVKPALKIPTPKPRRKP